MQERKEKEIFLFNSERMNLHLPLVDYHKMHRQRIGIDRMLKSDLIEICLLLAKFENRLVDISQEWKSQQSHNHLIACFRRL